MSWLLCFWGAYPSRLYSDQNHPAFPPSPLSWLFVSGVSIPLAFTPTRTTRPSLPLPCHGCLFLGCLSLSPLLQPEPPGLPSLSPVMAVCFWGVYPSRLYSDQNHPAFPPSPLSWLFVSGVSIPLAFTPTRTTLPSLPLPCHGCLFLGCLSLSPLLQLEPPGLPSLSPVMAVCFWGVYPSRLYSDQNHPAFPPSPLSWLFVSGVSIPLAFTPTRTTRPSLPLPCHGCLFLGCLSLSPLLRPEPPGLPSLSPVMAVCFWGAYPSRLYSN